ncbi:unnamed protein product [Hermetia illucens]|uniref:Flavin-containing monooxygenase n=1 Tax=Hermetia illucens TaxID=343691 RepID=A0A7R8YZQ8_HERIL|nr:senecionine N-oxygenase-like [Hermetia illucens]XP_037917209.1 senecionine N-oxygenase-like [Hermetia illucens]CAD7088006.1 unnamed protein product [Hermetia illucens]
MGATGKRVAVIGAGMAGICAAKHALQNDMEPTVFEQASQLGGTWVYTDNVGKDRYGLDVHSSMYKGLRTNLPKEIMGFPDFPIPDRGKSYLPSREILEFLESYAANFKVKERIKFEHFVIRVRPVDNEWEIIVKDLPNDRLCTMKFDFVIVCNGHYNAPLIPTLPGQDIYKGKQKHSHDYRCPEPYKDETVLVIGAGPSGIDLAYEISRVAKRVDLSHHLKEKPQTHFPPTVTQRPDVVEVTEDGVKFEDGNVETYSVILYCTGYLYTFPFISVDCGISVDDNYIQPLYKHIINIKKPTMAFIGIPFYACVSQMFDLQVRFALKFFSGKKALPSQKEMMEDTDREMQERWKRGYKKRQAHMMGADQGKYYDDLSKTAEIDNVKPVMVKLHNESSKRYLHDLVNFRKDIYRIIDDENFEKLN